MHYDYVVLYFTSYTSMFTLSLVTIFTARLVFFFASKAVQMSRPYVPNELCGSYLSTLQFVTATRVFEIWPISNTEEEEQQQ
jgi:hypothetical protein